MTSVDDVLNEFVNYDAEVDDLEQVVEGNQNDGSGDEDGHGSDEAEEEIPKEDKERVEPKKTRVVRNPRITLNPARLTGPRGVQVIREYFNDFKFKGQGHEKEDLDLIMKKLEHWAHRLYPKFKFDDCLEKIEHLGNKKLVSTHVRLIHMNMLDDQTANNADSDDNEEGLAVDTLGVPEKDDFDRLLEEQIALVKSTPSASSVTPGSKFTTPFRDRDRDLYPSTVMVPLGLINNCNGSPKTPSGSFKPGTLSEEQKRRILRNRQLAEERRKNRLTDSAAGENVHMDDGNKENIITVDITDTECDNSVDASVVRNNLSKNINDRLEVNENIETVDLTDTVVNCVGQNVGHLQNNAIEVDNDEDIIDDRRALRMFNDDNLGDFVDTERIRVLEQGHYSEEETCIIDDTDENATGVRNSGSNFILQIHSPVKDIGNGKTVESANGYETMEID